MEMLRVHVPLHVPLHVHQGIERAERNAGNPKKIGYSLELIVILIDSPEQPNAIRAERISSMVQVDCLLTISRSDLDS